MSNLESELPHKRSKPGNSPDESYARSYRSNAPINFLVPLLVGCTAITVCLSVAALLAPDEQPKRPKTLLRVNLFPYLPSIPDGNFGTMIKRIKTEFETKNPDVDLRVSINPNDDFYSLDSYKMWLSGTGPNTYDIVEPDTLFLAKIKDYIDEWPGVQEVDWQNICRAAASINGRIYAQPHWLCSFFIFTRDEAIAKARTGKELVAALTKANSVNPKVVGDLYSHWGTPAIYLDTWEETYTPRNPVEAVTTLLDDNTIESLKAFAAQGKFGGNNFCLDGTFHKNPASATMLFAKGQANSEFGYSETLFSILASSDYRGERTSVKMSPLVIGLTDYPLFFMDGFVLRKGCDTATRFAANRFVAYMQNPATYSWIEKCDDIPNAPIRYLIPATKSAFYTFPMKSDPFFQMIDRTLEHAATFPNAGIPEMVAKDIRSEIVNRLTAP